MMLPRYGTHGDISELAGIVYRRMALRSGSLHQRPEQNTGSIPVVSSPIVGIRSFQWQDGMQPARRGETLPADYPLFLEEVKRAVPTGSITGCAGS